MFVMAKDIVVEYSIPLENLDSHTVVEYCSACINSMIKGDVQVVVETVLYTGLVVVSPVLDIHVFGAGIPVIVVKFPMEDFFDCVVAVVAVVPVLSPVQYISHTPRFLSTHQRLLPNSNIQKDR